MWEPWGRNTAPQSNLQTVYFWILENKPDPTPRPWLSLNVSTAIERFLALQR